MLIINHLEEDGEVKVVARNTVGAATSYGRVKFKSKSYIFLKLMYCTTT